MDTSQGGISEAFWFFLGIFLHGDFFVPQGVCCSYNQKNNKDFMGEEWRKLFVGSGQVCVGAPNGSTAPTPLPSLFCWRTRSCGRGQPTCVLHLCAGRISPYAYCHLATTPSPWFTVNPSKITVSSHFLICHSVLIPFWSGLCLSSLLKWLFIYLFIVYLYTLEGKVCLYCSHLPSTEHTLFVENAISWPTPS